MISLTKHSEQSGRSMVEMLGVLAIIGVLSVGGIAGYSKAMTKFKITKTFDQVSMLVANIRTLYSGQRDYAGLSTDIAYKLGVVPAEMVGSDSETLVNAFQGKVAIAAATYNGIANASFGIAYSNLGSEACVQIVTSDWGSGSSSGFVGMNVETFDGTGDVTVGTPASATWQNDDLPVSPTTAAAVCSPDKDGTGYVTVTWYYM